MPDKIFLYLTSRDLSYAVSQLLEIHGHKCVVPANHTEAVTRAQELGREFTAAVVENKYRGILDNARMENEHITSLRKELAEVTDPLRQHHPKIRIIEIGDKSLDASNNFLPLLRITELPNVLSKAKAKRSR